MSETKPSSSTAPPAKVANGVKESELATVTLSPEAEQRLGIETAAVEKRKVARTLASAASQVQKAYAAGEVSYLFVLEINRQLLDARMHEAAARPICAVLRRGYSTALDFIRSKSELPDCIGVILSALLTSTTMTVFTTRSYTA